MPSSKNRLRELPSIDRVLRSAAGQQLIARYRRDYVTRRCRELIGELRGSILDGQTAALYCAGRENVDEVSTVNLR